jgi:hypothetical protein
MTMDDSRCAPRIRIGTRLWETDQAAKSIDGAIAELGPLWVEFDGVRYGCVRAASVHYGDQGGEGGSHFGHVIVDLAVAGVEIVSHVDDGTGRWVEATPARG